jgi:hypothetical protein
LANWRKDNFAAEAIGKSTGVLLRNFFQIWSGWKNGNQVTNQKS